MSDPSATVRSAPSAWRVGDVIEDLYEVLQLITAGGMGLVYRVHHRGWGIDLAVKTPRPDLVSSAQQITDFETEADTWVGLGSHPQVVACVYVRHLDGLPRVFAEWIDGGSLSEAIEAGRLYEGDHNEVLARILDVAIQFAWGLDYAHARGLIHQDVKPHNAMLTADGTVKVTDFGLAKARVVAGETVDAAPGTSVLAGYGGLTPAYCSPEQERAARLSSIGAALTRATDVWSWAISVWQMFTGEPPVQHGQVAAEAFEAFREDSWPKNPLIPPLPESVAELLQRCLDPDPVTRPRRMGELADELAAQYRRLVGVPYPRSRPDAATLLGDGLNNQALSLLDLRRSGEAERLWQQVLAADPYHLHAVYNYGLHRWRAGQTTDTDLITRLEAARAAHPGPHADRLLAAVHLERHDTATARELLAEAARAAPHDRDIAEALTVADRQAVVATRALTGHSDGVTAVAVAMSAHGRIAVSGNKDRTLKVWDLASGACLRTLTGHPDWVTAVAVAADVPVAASSDRRDVAAEVWDLNNGSRRCTLIGHTKPVWSVAVSADGRVAVSGSGDTTVRVWDVASGACRHVLTGHTGEVESVTVSVDGRVAVSASQDGTLRVWETFRGACLHILSAHEAIVSSVAVSGDGSIAVSGSWDNTVRVWDLVSGTCRRTLADHGDSVSSVAMSANGRIAVSAGGHRKVRIWDLNSGVCLSTRSGPAGAVAVAVSADGRVALSGGSDDQTLQVWEVPTGRGHCGEWSYARPQSARELIANAAAVQSAVGRAETLLANADGFGAATQLRIARAIPGYQRDPRLVHLWRRLARLAARGRLSGRVAAINPDRPRRPSLLGGSVGQRAHRDLRRGPRRPGGPSVGPGQQDLRVHPDRPHQRHRFGSGLSGRRRRGLHRLVGQNGADLGSGQQSLPAYPDRPHQGSSVGSDQRQRRNRRILQLGQHDSRVGRGHRAVPTHSDRPHRLRDIGGYVRRRARRNFWQLGQNGAGVGSGLRDLPAHLNGPYRLGDRGGGIGRRARRNLRKQRPHDAGMGSGRRDLPGHAD